MRRNQKPFKLLWFWKSLYAFLCFSLLFLLVGIWPATVSQAFAVSNAQSPAATTTIETFLQNASRKVSSSPRFSSTPAVPGAKLPQTPPRPLPQEEPATMTPVAYTLDDSFLDQSSAVTSQVAPTPVVTDLDKGFSLTPKGVPSNANSLEIKGQQSRLEVVVPRHALDISHTVKKTKAALKAKTYTLQIKQISGRALGTRVILASYVIQVVDENNQVIHGIRLKKPLTIRYHITSDEFRALGISSKNVIVSWPDLLQATRQAKQPVDTLSSSLHYDAKTQMLTGETHAIGSGTLLVSADREFQLTATPQQSSVSGNSGQFSYSYPLQAVAGPGGMMPPLQLTYSSASTNERTSLRAPSGPVGEGWSFDLGSVKVEEYAAESAAGQGKWYFLAGIGNASDRLIANPGSSGSFQTQHISYLKIQQVPLGNTSCFHIWDRSGTYYEAGCTADSQQYVMDAQNQYQAYRWDVNRIVLPFSDPTKARAIYITYLQDRTLIGVRDASVKQITYGPIDSLQDTKPDSITGTVDFSYHVPTVSNGDEPWATAYGNRTCSGSGSFQTTLRCDNPWGSQVPDVMSTLTLDRVTSYVGDHTPGATGALPAYQYDLAYNDTFSTLCTDPMSQTQVYCAGDHLLSSITPKIYQSGNAKALKPVQFGYSSPLTNRYRDPSRTPVLETTTQWRYLTSYVDEQTGSGTDITYETAYNNTHGTPEYTDQNGTLQDRHDPLYCSRHELNEDRSKRCEDIYGHPEDYAWSHQVVTKTRTRGSDSSSLAEPETIYNYRLATISLSGCGSGPCVSSQWIPGYDKDGNGKHDGEWRSFYHSEFRGFQMVLTTSPAKTLVVSSYFSTKGPYTVSSDGGNYNAGQMYQQDIYRKDQMLDADLLRRTEVTYTGINNPTTCDYRVELHQTYTPCLVAAKKSLTTFVEGNVGGNPSWVGSTITYDDIDATTGALKSGYHNVTQVQYNEPDDWSITQQWTYTSTDKTSNGIIYYNVGLPTSSKTIDNNGHIWRCQTFRYDEGSPSGIPVPAAGLLTSTTQYRLCNGSGELGNPQVEYTSYMGYDAYHNLVATVDPLGVSQPTIYSTKGCQLTIAPTYLPPAWTQGRFTSCSFYKLDTAAAAQPYQEKNALNHTNTSTYDPQQGYALTQSVDANGQASQLSYEYQGNGNVTVKTKQPGETDPYTALSFHQTSCDQLTRLPCSVSRSSTSLYSSAIESTFYDNQGRVTQTRTPLNATQDIVTVMLYDDAHNITFESLPVRVSKGTDWIDPALLKDEQGASVGGTQIQYDALGRVQATKSPLLQTATEPGISCAGLPGLWSTCVERGYGSISFAGEEALYVKTINANNQQEVQTGDALGFSSTTLRYAQRGSIAWEESVSSVDRTANALGLTETVSVNEIHPEENIDYPGSSYTLLTYNDQGQLIEEYDPDRLGDVARGYSYDPNGNIHQITYGAIFLGFSHDLLGRVGCVQAMRSLSKADGTGQCYVDKAYFTFKQNTYDVNDLGVQGTTSFPIGRLTKTDTTTYDTSQTTQRFQYDQRGRTVTETLKLTLPAAWNVTTPLPEYRMTQAYNSADQETMTQTMVGSQTGYTFSQAYDSETGVVLGLSNTAVGTNSLAALDFNLHGLVSKMHLKTPGGAEIASSQFDYDGKLQPIRTQTIWQPGSGKSGQLFQTERAYDAIGNVVTVKNAHAVVTGQSLSGGSETQNFCYDHANRLIWASNIATPSGVSGSCGSASPGNTLSGAGYTNTYQYTNLDLLKVGPLNGSGQYQYLYCDHSYPHQLTGVYPVGTTCDTTGNTAVYQASYDSGDLVKRTYNGDETRFSYDSYIDTLISATTVSGQSNTYLYDSSNQRVLTKTTQGGQTTLTVEAFGVEEYRYTGSGQLTSQSHFYFLNGQRIGNYDGTNIQFYATDELGSVLATFQATGNVDVKGNALYGPFGNKRYEKGNLGTTKGFTGQTRDATGLDYFNARYYDPVVGRFLSMDPIMGNPQGVDPYMYVEQNPETYSDPSGYLCWPVCTTLAGAGIGFLVGGAWSIGSQYFSGHGIDWGQVWKDALAGGVEGGVIGLAGPVVGSIYGAMAGSAAGQLTSNALNGQPLHENVLESALLGGATEGIFSLSSASRGMRAIEAGCGVHSFSADTPVATPDGEQAIGSLKVGDKVIAFNPETKQQSSQTVEHVFLHHDTDLVDITLQIDPDQDVSISSKKQDADIASHGSQAPPTTETIHTTEKHPWLTSKGWVNAGELHVGDTVQRLDGSFAKVVAWNKVSGERDMYDLTVSNVHTFAVGEQQEVVHNNDGCEGELPEVAGRDIVNAIKQAKSLAYANVTNNQQPRGAGAIMRIAGTKKTIARAVSGPRRPGRFAPLFKHLYGNAGEGACAEFGCTLNLTRMPRRPIDIYIWQVAGKGPCVGCRNTLRQLAEANGYPVRAFWMNRRGQISSKVFG